MTADELYAEVVEALRGEEGVEFGRAFSSEALKVGGKIFAMESRGRLVVKLPKARVDELVESGRAERFNPGHGRLMKEWASFEPATTADWLALAREAYAFVGG